MNDDRESILADYYAQLKARKESCSCGRDAELMACEHLFYGIFSDVSWTRGGLLYCGECDCDIGDFDPTWIPICRNCARIIIDQMFDQTAKITVPPSIRDTLSHSERGKMHHTYDDY